MIESRDRSAVQLRISRAQRAPRRIYGGFTKPAGKPFRAEEGVPNARKAGHSKSEGLGQYRKARFLDWKAYSRVGSLTFGAEAASPANPRLLFKGKRLRIKRKAFFFAAAFILERTALPYTQMRRRFAVMRILVIEDEDALREDLRQQLTDTGFIVDVAADGEEGAFAGLNYPIDAAIVDLGLPKRAGLDVIREWRAKQRTFPIVILTLRNNWPDRIEGLCAGADDYVGKPFNFKEVTLRVQGLMRRANGWSTPQIECGAYVLDTHAQILTVRGEPVELTSYEYRLLAQLMLHAGKPLSAAELSEHMYQEDMERDSNVIAQLIFRVRRKLDPLGAVNPIETVHGRYRFAIPRGRSI
jgi:two-component system response regulator PhoP